MLFLQQGLVPIENSGKEVSALEYKVDSDCEDEDYLHCDDISRLADALKGNTKFNGPLNLENQRLTDISGMYIGRILAQGDNISKLCFAHKGDNKITHKSGEYIGQGLLDNPTSKIHKLDLQGLNLGETGLQRVLEAVNNIACIEKLHVGVVTDSGLKILAAQLAHNTTLEELQFSETPDHQKYWTEESRCCLVETLKLTSVKLKKVKAKFQKANRELAHADAFQDELEFYTDQKSALKKKDKRTKERMTSCDTDHMFENMQRYIENTDKNEKMPVRKFFNNTFGQLLNDALFALKKRISKSTGEEALELQRHEA